MKVLRTAFQGFALLLGFVFLTGCVGAFFGTEMPARLRDAGVSANAKILGVWDTGWTVNDDPVVGMRLEVLAPDRPAFEASIKRYRVSRIQIADLRPGATIPVRFDPKDPTVVSVEGDASQELPALPAGDRARIQNVDVVRLADHYETPAVPPAFRGVKVFLATSIVGEQDSQGSAEQIVDGCRSSALTFFDRVGWRLVHDAGEPHDLVVHVECTAAARIVAAAEGTYVLLPIPARGIRIEGTRDGLSLQLTPVPRTFRCPNSNLEECLESVKQYAAADVIGQLVHSKTLRNYLGVAQPSSAHET